MIIEKYPKSSSNAFGFVLLKPQDYSASVTYKLVVFIHGNGNRGDGDIDDITKYGNSLSSELKEAVDKYKVICIAPQYAEPGNNAVIDHALNYASANLMIDKNCIGLSGFSLGGGEITRYVTTSLQNADKFAWVVSIGGLNKLITSGVKYIALSSLPMLFFHSKNDPSASVSNTNTAVSTINAQTISVAAKSVLYEGDAHDIVNRVFNTEIYPWVGNEIPNTLWEYVLNLTKDNPVPVPSKEGPILPIAIAEDIITRDGTYVLIGNKSRNFIAGKCKWECISAPPSVNRWNINACGYIDCGKGQVTPLTVEGDYVFRLTVMDSAGKTDTTDITVTYSKGGTVPDPDPVKKTVKSINHIGYWLLFTDDTTAQATSVITDTATGKTTYKISDKEEYIL